jgi:hypothetical protein
MLNPLLFSQINWRRSLCSVKPLAMGFTGIAHALIPVKPVALGSTLHKMNLTKGK